MQWKKIVAAGSLSFLMAGSTLAFAQLQNYPSPFVTSAGPETLVIVGADAAPSDVVGAIDVAARLGGEVTTEVSVGGFAGVVNIAGEGREVGTRTQPIFLGSNLASNGLRSTMTDSDLPNLLMSGTVEDTDANEEYDYDQFIKFSNDFPLVYSRISGEEADPSYKFGDFGTSATANSNFFQLQTIFTNEVNMTTVVSEEIELFGGQYTFSPETSSACTGGSDKVVLFGASDQRLLTEGEEVTVTIAGSTHTIKLLVVSDATTVAVSVDGQSKSLDVGQSTTISGVSIFVDDIFFSSKEGTVSSAEIGIGAREITFQDGQQVEVGIGGSTDFVDGSLVDLSCSSGFLTQLLVYVTAENSQGDFLKVGGTFVDPVFGTFRVGFPSVLPATNDMVNREGLTINPSGDNDVDITLTNDKGDTKTWKWTHANNTAAANGGLILGDDNSDEIVVVEGWPFTRDDFFVVDAGEFSRIFEVTGVSSLGTSDSEVRIRDVFSGDTMEVDLGADNAVEKVIDGQSYFFNVSGTTNNPVISVGWGTGADLNRDAADPTFGGIAASASADPGSFITVFPKLKTKLNDEGVAFEEQVNLTGLDQGVAYSINLPTGTITVTSSSDASSALVAANTTEDSEPTVLTQTVGTNLTVSPTNPIAVRVGRTANGGANYRLSWTDAGTDGSLTIDPATAAGAAVTEPRVTLVEEEDDDGNVGAVSFAATWDDSDDESGVGAPVITWSNNAASNSGTKESDTDITQSVSRWGTWIERDSSDQARVSVWYPDEEVSAAVVVLDNDATASVGGGASGSVRSATPIKTSLGKLDVDVTSGDRNSKSFILVGGPAVNDLVAELGTAGKTWDRAGYVAQGEGTALIDYVANAFTNGRAALVVAGYSAADTRVATSWLQDFDAHDLTGARVVLKNGVKTTVTG
jgi:hypothetical protein